MECYLDNAATTRPFSEVRDLVTRVMYEDFGKSIIPSHERCYRRALCETGERTDCQNVKVCGEKHCFYKRRYGE